jgi:tyrosinase
LSEATTAIAAGGYTRIASPNVRSPALPGDNFYRVRRSIEELQSDYEAGLKEPLEKLWRAWIAMQSRAPDDPHSFFTLAGFHGAPAGYCNHGTVLFPTWHRVYLLKVEEALQLTPGCEDVMLPYWDETSENSLSDGLPWALTQESIELDGAFIRNPLRSFSLTQQVHDDDTSDGADYSKPDGYETVRYPLSGLVGTSADRENTRDHNNNFPVYETRVELLNQNVVNWLKWSVIIDGAPTASGHVAKKFQRCLKAPNYTLFSNSTSSAAWNALQTDPDNLVTPLESPHNSIHVAIGGYHFEVEDGHASPVSGANGDIGENDTAAFDPVFYFHHCFIDCVFWLWQRLHGATDSLEILQGYPGTNSSDDGGRPTDTALDMDLTIDSPLNPFNILMVDGTERIYTSSDCINVESQLNLTYSQCSLERAIELPHSIISTAIVPESSRKMVSVTEIDRATIKGSFVVAVYGVTENGRVLLDVEAVLSRWHVEGCANCRTHLEAATHFTVPAKGRGSTTLTATDTSDFDNYDVQVQTRSGPLADGRFIGPGGMSAVGGTHATNPPFRVEVR